tara:strand:- start:436 stop:642 length:207 start_codon:yes stop_codon:yes gene_type:complete
MALENSEVLANLKDQIKEVQAEVERLSTVRTKLIGAIEVLEQIEESNAEVEESTDEESTDEELVETSE